MHGQTECFTLWLWLGCNFDYSIEHQLEIHKQETMIKHIWPVEGTPSLHLHMVMWLRADLYRMLCNLTFPPGLMWLSYIWRMLRPVFLLCILCLHHQPHCQHCFSLFRSLSFTCLWSVSLLSFLIHILSQGELQPLCNAIQMFQACYCFQVS